MSNCAVNSMTSISEITLEEKDFCLNLTIAYKLNDNNDIQ